MKDIESNIINYLQKKADAATISELTKQFAINRNTIAKYLQVLVRRGDVEVAQFGMMKFYRLSSRIPAKVMLRLVMDPACIIDMEKNIVSCNKYFLELFSFNASEQIPHSHYAFPEEFCQDDLIDAITNGIQGEMSEEICMMNISGRNYTLHVKILPLILEDNTYGCGVIFRDESRVQPFSFFLEESEGRYRAIVDDQPDLVCRRAPDLTLIYINKAYCDAARRSADDLLGKRLFPFTLTSLSLETEAVYQQITLENPIIEFETKDVTSNGLNRWLQWYVRGHFSAHGELLEYNAIGRDITQLKRCEEQNRLYLQSVEYIVHERTHALQESNQKLAEQLMVSEKKAAFLSEQELWYRAVFNNIAELTLLFEQDEEGEADRIIEANIRACQVLQYNHDELVLMVSSDIITEKHNTKYQKSYVKQFTEDQIIRYQGIMMRKDGGEILVDISEQRFRMKEKSVVLMICRCMEEPKDL